MAQNDDILFPCRCSITFLFKFQNLLCQGGFTHLCLIFVINDRVIIPFFNPNQPGGFFILNNPGGKGQ